MNYRVIFSSVAGSQTDDLYAYLAERAGEPIAESYVGGIQALCLGLADFPNRGAPRDHPAVPDLRIIVYKGNVTIAYTVDEAAGMVTILGIFYGGQDYAHRLATDWTDE